MTRKGIAILIMVSIAFFILLLGFYYGCRSGSETRQESDFTGTTLVSLAYALTASPASTDCLVTVTGLPRPLTYVSNASMNC